MLQANTKLEIGNINLGFHSVCTL